MGYITAVQIIFRFLNGTVYSYHGYFRFGTGFMPVFVKFYGSLMVHGYGSENSRVLNGIVQPRAVMHRGFETMKIPEKIEHALLVRTTCDVFEKSLRLQSRA